MNKELLIELESGTKSAQIKRQIIAYFIEHGHATITDLAKYLTLSVPTVTKFILDLASVGSIKDYGKLETAGGRYPVLYGLHPDAGFFIGVDVKHRSVNIGLIDFIGEMKKTSYGLPYNLENTPEKMDELCDIIKKFIKDAKLEKEQVLNININLPGRINPKTGFSYTHFNFDDKNSLSKVLAEKLGTSVTIDNDTRGMAYGEYKQGCAKDSKYKDVLYINLSWGTGLGIILDGDIYLGKSGYSGEFGHITVYENQVLCSCGKKGCLETEVSGSAFHREVISQIKKGESSILSKDVDMGKNISLDDIINAANQEDILCLEILNEIGRKLGKQVAGLINIFNPELVIIGGTLSLTGEYLKESVQAVVRTYSLNLVNKDTEIVTATLDERAGVVGACMLARTRRFAVD